MVPDKRFVMRGDGKPFFWLGDTAWELIHRLNREEADYYLKNRADKGFTVIQTVILAELDGLTQPNPYGHLPLANNDPTQPNEAYFQHVDYVVNKAASLGLVVGLLPTWGDKFNKKWGKDPEIFTPANARTYGEYVGKRYKGKPVIWILGGDRSPETDTQAAIVQAMAEGVKIGNGGTQLMTYHPTGGGNSAAFFHKDKWLSINMVQSGHGARDSKNYIYQRQNYALFPVKPTLDGEPRYEDLPVGLSNTNNDYFTAHDVRQAAWWAVLAGACGHTYGNHNIWQFFEPSRGGVMYARTYWRRALDYPGAFEMGFMRRLFEAHPWQKLIPNQEVILNENPQDGGYQMAAVADDSTFLVAYTPKGKSLKIDLSRLASKTNQLVAYWYNPRDGFSTKIGEFKPEGSVEFKPTIVSATTDWTLVIDDASQLWAGFGLKK
ncbi:MAG: DUF4038 domain-containing protein [Cytophagia bacterium]|nr:MAG: DUF4038 domain-containing protein [Cytophagales bacterium]TAG39803.1 MAG: DUF4038 domain-containing protein [Cytophagia bacterium]TAG47797.1 MAG: DUF4038 domain-containing protein [Runella slithyformis]TAG84101.1 MAG: DUF4038 domain-containing protein [Cytophagales bacterium]